MDRNRRAHARFAALGGLGGGGGGGGTEHAVTVVASSPVPPPPIIDVHTHFWDPSRVPKPTPWPAQGDGLDLLFRTVLPPDFEAVAGPCGVTGTVVVAASGELEDNLWVLDLAAACPIIVGLCGSVAPDRPEFAAEIRFAVARTLWTAGSSSTRALCIRGGGRRTACAAMVTVGRLGCLAAAAGSWPRTRSSGGSVPGRLPDSGRPACGGRTWHCWPSMPALSFLLHPPLSHFGRRFNRTAERASRGLTAPERAI